MSCPSIYSKVKSVFGLFVIFVGFGLPVLADGAKNLPNELNAGKLLYHAAMNRADSVSDWVMEGPGQVSFKDGWMHMQSPNEAMHHVFWCPERFPESFIAQWEAQNMETDAGLCIVFFAAAGLDGRGIFSEELPKRDGNFKQYTKGKIRCYHTSYYANAAHNPDRQQTNLRKNPGFHLVQEGEEGIPTKSKDIHTITLAKEGSHIRLWVDDRKVIDWTDEGKIGGQPHGDGYIGFRQMQWTHFRYRNFRVWAVGDSETPNINSTSAEEDQKPESNDSASASVPAFPGAQGFGSTTPGGRGGRVIAVTSLEAEGPGSFREACEADGPRIVIFRVGGTITIENKIVIQNPFITIAGQTAPGDGICIRGAALQIATHDVIVRGLRIRIGDGPGPEPGNRDALAIANRSTQPYNIIIDHCSLSWAIDENLQLWYPCNNITIQWCIISEGLHNSLHPKRPHSCGLIIGNYAKNISAHHNLFAHNDGRSPLMKQGSESEFINNVVYNWGDFGASKVSNWEKHDATVKSNIIGNYYIPGTNSSIKPIDLQAPERLREGTKIFVKDNIGPGRISDDTDDWALVSGDEKFRANQPAIPLSNVSIVSASSAYEQVIKYAGAVTPKRDAVDQRVIDSVINETGQIIDSQRDVGGWPRYTGGEAPPDSDGDGMPNEWERANGLNPNDAGDGALDLDGDAYTNVEEFLNQTDPKQPDDGLEPVH